MTVGNSVQLMEDARRNVDLIVSLIEADDFAVPTAPHVNDCNSCHLPTLCRLDGTLEYRYGQRNPGKKETMTRATVWYPRAKTDLWEILAVASVLVCHPSSAGLDWVNKGLAPWGAQWPQECDPPHPSFNLIPFDSPICYDAARCLPSRTSDGSPRSIHGKTISK